MKLIKNFMTRDQIAEDLAAMSLKEESPAELEYQCQQYWDTREYDICLDLISRAIELNPSQYSYFKRAQVYWKLNELDNALEDLNSALSLKEDYENALDLKEFVLERIKRERDYTMGVYR